jgi:fructuronate reductase
VKDHHLQIAMDGSQKIPQRWLETLAYHQKQGRQCPAILEAIAAWIVHIRGDKNIVDDPMRNRFSALWQTSGEAHIASALFGNGGQFAQYWEAREEDLTLVNHWVSQATLAG